MSDKYDRQVRIWGAHGQMKLHNARVVLLGCDPVGVETLKNLVLPGVGYIIIVDDKVVSELDVENNFFIPYSTIGQNRAKVVLEHLLEMNEDVKGEWHEHYQINGCDLIIANEQTCLLTQYNLIQLQTCGMIGKLRIYSPDCHIIESKPMGQKYDLRVFNPFKELQDYFDSIELEGDETQLSHIPYIVLLHKALQQYRVQFGKNPETFNDKFTVFKQVLQSVCKNIPFEPGSNVQEAYNNLEQAFEFKEWKDVIEDIEQEPLTPFRILMKALKDFVQQYGVPPLGRPFPDMKCYTQTYVNLKKNIFGKKVEEDFQQFKKLCKSDIDDETIRLFIDNVANIRSINYRTIEQELATPVQIEYFENDCQIWYIVLRAFNKFQQQNNRVPNINDVEQFNELVQNEAKLLSANVIEEKYINEICRYNGGKLHMIAGVLGGMASQEAVKLITNQFVPINNTLIYDGLKGEAETFEL